MRPWVIALIIVVSLLVCCCGGTVLMGGTAFMKGSQDIGEGKAWAQRTIPTLAKPWSEEEVWKVSSELYRASMSRERHDRFIRTLKNGLGDLVELGEPTTQNWNVSTTTRRGTVTILYLEVPAKFKKADAKLLLTLAKKDDRWMIDGLKVNSDAFLVK